MVVPGFVQAATATTTAAADDEQEEEEEGRRREREDTRAKTRPRSSISSSPPALIVAPRTRRQCRTMTSSQRALRVVVYVWWHKDFAAAPLSLPLVRLLSLALARVSARLSVCGCELDRTTNPPLEQHSLTHTLTHSLTRSLLIQWMRLEVRRPCRRRRRMPPACRCSTSSRPRATASRV